VVPGRPESTATLSSTSHPREPKAAVEAQAVQLHAARIRRAFAGRSPQEPASNGSNGFVCLLGTTRAGSSEHCDDPPSQRARLPCSMGSGMLDWR
jgi:hypothetical protein